MPFFGGEETCSPHCWDNLRHFLLETTCSHWFRRGDPSPISYQTLEAKHEPRNLNLETQTLSVCSCMVYLPYIECFGRCFLRFFRGWMLKSSLCFLNLFFFFPPLCEPGIMESRIVRSTDFHSFILHHFR